MKKVKTAFFGSSRYSIPYLELLYQHELIDLSLVVSQPDKPVGRGLVLTPSPVKEWAKQKQILTLTPSDLGNALFLGALSALPLKMAIIAYYGLKIPKAVIDLFPSGMLNIHHSLLPRHKGSNPIPWTILAGDSKTGTTIIKINEKFDEGEIAAFAETEVLGDDTAETLRRRLDEKALVLLEKMLPKYLNGKISLRHPGAKISTYEPRISPELARIDWSKTDPEIERTVRAFAPWPGAWTTLEELCAALKVKGQMSKFKSNGRRLKILKAHLDEEGRLAIDTVQVEGKTPISFTEFRTGYLQ